MLTVKEWMELVDYRITEGDIYGWQCFGPDAYSLSSWNGDHDGYSFNIVFDTKTQAVYTVEVCDYGRSRAYRIINPDHKNAHDDESENRGVNKKEAWDEVDFVDLEDDDDFKQKSLAIKAGEDYDTRVSVPIEIPDDVLLKLMKQAHDRDVTFNKFVEDILWEAIHAEEHKGTVWPHFDADAEMISDLEELRREYNFGDRDEDTPKASMKSKKKKQKG